MFFFWRFFADVQLPPIPKPVVKIPSKLKESLRNSKSQFEQQLKEEQRLVRISIFEYILRNFCCNLMELNIKYNVKIDQLLSGDLYFVAQEDFRCRLVAIIKDMVEGEVQQKSVQSSFCAHCSLHYLMDRNLLQCEQKLIPNFFQVLNTFAR